MAGPLALAAVSTRRRAHGLDALRGGSPTGRAAGQSLIGDCSIFIDHCGCPAALSAISEEALSNRSATMATTPIDLHYWPTPNGHKITIFLEEAGLPYNIIPVNIGKGDQFKPDFLAISPNNRMPAIVDHHGPDGKPISVFESGAILQYLGRKTGKFYPGDERARVEVDQWLFWQMGGLGPMA